MTRARCVLAAFVIAFAVLQPGAPAAQQYDARPDILRAKIREVGAGFVGYVKSATADTVTVTSDGSYSVIAKGEEYTFQITPNTTVSQMKEDGEFKPPQALQANELRAAQFVGVVEDTQNFRSDRHIALQIYTLPASIAGGPPAGLAAAPAAPPPAPPDLSPPMQQRYREGYADWRRKREQIHGSQFVGSVQSVTPDTVTVISDRDSSIWLRKGSNYTFHFTPVTKIESDDPSSGKELRGGEQVTIRYRDMGDTHLALGIHIWSTSPIDAPPSLAKQEPGRVKPEDDPDALAGGKQMDAKQYRDAIASFDRSTANLPQMPYAYFNRGECYMHLEQYDRATQDFTAAIARYSNLEEQPSNLALELGVAYQERGHAAVHLHQDDHALADYNQALRYLAGADQGPLRDGYYQAIYEGRCSALHNLGQDQVALEDCNRALARHPKDGYRYLTRAVVQFRLGREDLARTDFNRAAELDSSLRPGLAGLVNSLKSGKVMHLDP